MSKGPGKLQVKIMETLKQYHDLGKTLEWRFQPGGSWMAALAFDDDKAAYESGRRIPVWMLERDLKSSRPALSRALKGLENMGYVLRFAGDLAALGDKLSCEGDYTKYVSLTIDGEKWLKR